MRRALFLLLVACGWRADRTDGLHLETRAGPFGEYVTADGRPVYTFSGDAPGQTACLTNCATVWPPVLVEGRARSAAQAIDTTRLEGIARPDGSRQLTFHGMPLYYSASEFTAQDALGHYAMSFGGRFTLVSPAGKPLPAPK